MLLDMTKHQPTWEKFCASLHDSTGRVVPVQDSPHWQQYFNIWAVGYLAALREIINET